MVWAEQVVRVDNRSLYPMPGRWEARISHDELSFAGSAYGVLGVQKVVYVSLGRQGSCSHYLYIKSTGKLNMAKSQTYLASSPSYRLVSYEQSFLCPQDGQARRVFVEEFPGPLFVQGYSN